MRAASRRFSLRKFGRSLIAVGAIAAVFCGRALAQNLTEGKSGDRFFSEGCATCHRSASGLAHGRFRLTLFLFLREHYSSNSDSAWALTSYLESFDEAPRGRSHVAAKPSSPAASASEAPLRPPASIPGR